MRGEEMAENKFRYGGIFKRRSSTAESGLPSINPKISGMMFPTAYNAVNSKEWVESRKKIK